MKKNISKSIWLIMTGFSCNSNCVICSTKPKAEFYPDRSTEEIIEDLKKGKKKGYNKVEFTGGEPTIRPDILYLIKTAKDLGYGNITVSTNGAMLSYKSFCQKIIKNGLNSVAFTLSAHNSRLGDAICRTPEAFNRTVQGIKNVLEYPSVEVSVNTVVFQLNYKYLQQIGVFIYDLGVRCWHILDLIPDGYAKKFYKILAVSPSNLSNSFNNLDEVIKKFNLVIFFDFPLCLFPSQIFKNPKVNFITAQSKMETIKQTGYKPKRFRKSIDNSYNDIHKQRIEICKKCKFYKSCGGIWKDIIDIYGENDIKDLAKKHRLSI